MTVDEKQSNPPKAELRAHGDHNQRDHFVDNWRGIFHIVLLLDHLPFILPIAFSVLGDFFQPLGYVSVAEGFVFLSGYVSGLVYTRVKRERGINVMRRKAFVRVLEIYGCYILASISLVALIKFLGDSSAQWGSWNELIGSSLPVATGKLALLLSQPAFLEILPMYCLFLLLTPFAITQLEKGRWRLVAIVSLSLWIAAQFGIREQSVGMLSSFVQLQTGFFNGLGWQILFVTGLICGHKTFAEKTRWLPAGERLTTIIYAGCVALFALRHGFLEINVEEKWINGSSLGLLRLLNFAGIAFLLCRFRARIEKHIHWKGFAFLSKYSLQVFAFHLIPIYLAALWLDSLRSSDWLEPFIVVLWCVCGLFAIALLTRFVKKLFDLTNKPETVLTQT